MPQSKFILNQPVSIEETRHYEFKEVRGSNPVDAIKNTADEYVVAFLNSEGGRIIWGIRDSDRAAVGVKVNAGQRDEIRRVVCEKLGQIQPSITPTAYSIVFHNLYERESSTAPIADLHIIEIITPRIFTRNLYFTGGNAAFVKTDGGKKKLTGAELNDEIYRRLRADELNGARGSSAEAVSELQGVIKAYKGSAKRPPGKQWLDESLAKYEAQLEAKVSRVKIFGDIAPFPLEEVFVELTINEGYDRRRDDLQHLGLLDAELRRLRAVFGGADEDRDSDVPANQSILAKNDLKPDELLLHPTHAVITGAPGCGKTTLLRYLTWQSLKRWRESKRAGSGSEQGSLDLGPNVRFPIFLELKQLTPTALMQARNLLEDLLFDKTFASVVKPQDAAERGALRQYFRQLLDAGRVAVFLDGLDEVSGASFFSELQSMVTEFLQSAYGVNLVIISTRPFAVRQLGDAQLLEIAPFNLTQIEQFIKYYYGSMAESAQFKRELKRRRELRELARVPALLGFILQMWRKHGLVSDNKIELYDTISREQAQQLDSDKEGVQPERRWLVSDPDGTLKRDFMRRLAFAMIFRDVTNPDEAVTRDLDRLVFSTDTLLKTAREFAKQVEKQEGILVNPRHLVEDTKATALLRQVGAEKYAFMHLTLQEYLAAIELAGHEDCERIFCRAYFNPTLAGMEVLPMTLGIVSNPDKLYGAIHLLPESLNFTGMNLLARGLDYGAAISDDKRQELTNRLIDFIQSYDINIERSEFVRSFAWMRKHPSYSEKVVTLLSHPDSSVQSRAATLLGMIGGNRIVPQLLKALKDTDEAVRRSAAGALGRIGDERAVPILLKHLEEDSDNSIIYLEALNKLGLSYDEQVNKEKINKILELIGQSELDEKIKEILKTNLTNEGLTDWLREAIRSYCLEGICRSNSQILRAAIDLYRDEPESKQNYLFKIINLSRRSIKDELTLISKQQRTGFVKESGREVRYYRGDQEAWRPGRFS